MPKKKAEMVKKEEGDVPLEKEEVSLVFRKAGEPKMMEVAGLPKPEEVAIKLEELLKWFKSYRVDSIELSVEGTIKSGTAISLLISAEGKGGMKVVLKPK